ncbi:MAG: RNA polymerase sigma factor FliA [Elusimicrobia bacterium]|nr:RNA polymerase sigma factor FliA [Elusimicrobiota bacterium]
MSIEANRQDQLGTEEVLELHEGFVRSRAMRWMTAMPHLEMYADDLMQEGRIALWQAMDHYDATRGVTLLTYAGRWVDNLMRNFVWRKSQLIRYPQGKAVSFMRLDEAMDGDEERTMHGALTMPDPETWSADDRHTAMMRALEKLTEPERRVVVECVMKGRLQREVAAEMGVSHTWVQCLMERAMTRLRRLMGVKVDKKDLLAGWVPMKTWLAQRAEEQGVTPHAVRLQLYRGTRRLPEARQIGRRFFVRAEAVEGAKFKASRATLESGVAA